MTDSHREAIWGRGEARKIMKEARSHFRNVPPTETDKVAAYVALASVHYSLIKRYSKGIRKMIGAWHAWRAVSHARIARLYGLTNADQVDVVSRILLKVPKFLGGNPSITWGLILDSLTNEKSSKISPHTNALLLITLAEIEMKMGSSYDVQKLRIERALALEGRILGEPSAVIAKRQLCRVFREAAMFYYNYAPWPPLGGEKIRDLLSRALNLAKETGTRDQELEILKLGAEKRIFHPVTENS